MSFWGELKRRNVYKVGVAYAIVAWLLIQFAAIAFPHLNFPSWAVPFVIVILIIGFPIALLLAWAYEVTPEGIKLTKEVPLAESITHLTGQKLNYIVTGLLVLAVGFLAVKVFFLERHTVEPELASIEPEQAPVVADVEEATKTIAVLPFVNLSSDPEQEYFVDGLSEEILNSLCQIPDLGVTGRTSSFSFKDTNKTIQEIANILGVENILEGSVRKAGNSLRITAQLVRASDGLHLWSKTYDRELKGIFAVQEDIATAVADELKVTLGIGQSFKQAGGTDNVEAYEHYLIAKGEIVDTSDLAVFHDALKETEAAIALDPNFALAWAKKSDIHLFLSIYVPSSSTVIEQTAALSAAQKAVDLQPDLVSGYISLGSIKTIKGDFIEARSAFNRALELNIESLSGDELAIGIHYSSLGYFKKAYKLFDEMRQNDPLNKDVRANNVLISCFLGDTKAAEEEYERVKTLVGGQWSRGDSFISVIRIGANKVVSRDMIVFSDRIYDVGKEYIDSPEKALAELHRIYDNNDNLSSADLVDISTWAAYFGDADFSIEAAEKSFHINFAGIWNIWYHVMHNVRQLPRFKKFIREIGLVDYWEQFGWPDICRPLDNGDFECD